MGSEERMAILNMLEEGKISAEEAERLLQALGSPSEERDGGASPERERLRRERGRRGRARDDLGDLVDEIGDEVRGAVRSVQASEIGRAVSQEVGKAVDSLQRMDMGGLVGDIVEQVREAVSDAVARSAAHVVETEQDWSFQAAGLSLLHAETISGLIQVAGADTDHVTVHALKRVRGHDQAAVAAFAEEMALRAVADGQQLRLYQEPPKPPHGIRAEVRYRILCPSSLPVELRLVNGNVSGESLDGGVDAQTTNGNVRIMGCSGRVAARTRNGNARAEMKELREEAVLETTNGNVSLAIHAGQAQVKATSSNGNVKVALPEGFSGQVNARTTNGIVANELALTRVVEQKRNLLIGQLGNGGEWSVHLQTLNGNARLIALHTESQGS